MTFDSIPGWYDFEASYQDAVARFDSGTFIEVGCFLGRSLCHLGELVKKSGKPIRVIGIDTCRGSGIENGVDHHAQAIKEGGGTFAGTLHRNIIECGLADTVEIIVSTSEKASTLFGFQSVEFVFIDADHSYEGCKKDIELWRPKIKLGGVCAGDDYGIPGEPPIWPGVRMAVDELLPQAKPFPHDSWMWRNV